MQDLGSLEREMRGAARGERPAPAEAGRPSSNSVEAVVRLLTPENRELLAMIRDRKPQSVAELVQMSGRKQPNFTRTLAKMEAAGFVTMKAVGRRRKAPIHRQVLHERPYLRLSHLGRVPEMMRHQANYYNEEASRRLTVLNMMAMFGVWLAVAILLIVMIFRIFTIAYLGPINELLQ